MFVIETAGALTVVILCVLLVLVVLIGREIAKQLDRINANVQRLADAMPGMDPDDSRQWAADALGYLQDIAGLRPTD